MAVRKKTPDILEDLLGEKKKRMPTRQKTSPGNAPDSKPRQKELEEKMEKSSEKTEIKAQTEPEKSKSVENNRRAHFVTFHVGGRDYALPLEQVERALRMVALLPVPDSPPWIAGLMNLHDRVIPVLDLRRRLGLPPKDPHPDDRLIVIQSPKNTLSFMVDEVKEVIDVPLVQMEKPSGSLARSRPLKGVIRYEEKLILILDPDRLEPEEIVENEK
jgi:purine-binding chemotaxis protein CheW